MNQEKYNDQVKRELPITITSVESCNRTKETKNKISLSDIINKK